MNLKSAFWNVRVKTKTESWNLGVATCQSQKLGKSFKSFLKLFDIKIARFNFESDKFHFQVEKCDNLWCQVD